jgi:3-oxoacyl-[acyl-carrier-protein] synthase-3
VTREVLERAGLGIEDIDVFAYHQANGRILRAVGQRLSLPRDRVLNVIEWTGNTSAASIPMALDHGVAEGKLKDGDLVLMAAIGGGAIWGASIVEWGR